MFTSPICLLAVLFAAAPPSAGGQNLLPNGDFSAVENGLPAAWSVVDTGQAVAIDRDEKPAGCAQSLRIVVKIAAPNEGQVTRKLGNLKPGATYVLEGSLKSTVDRLGFLQVKLYAGGKERKRLTVPDPSGPEWKRVRFSFSTEDADEVEILCRYRQGQEHVGQTAWFAQVVLTEAGPPRLLTGEAVSTFQCLGIRVRYDGGPTSKTICRVQYRKQGDMEWRQGMDLVPCPWDQEFRGSLFWLSSGTEYEVECQLLDAGKPLSAVRLTGVTWGEEVPVGEVRELPAGSSKAPLVIRDQGKPEAWILYRPAAGGATTIDAGREADQAVLFEGAAYVVLENATLRGGQRDCVNVTKSHHIRVRRCDIAEWGDPGTPKPGLDKGLYVDKNGRQINYHVGVRVSQGSSQAVVEDNFIHSPRGTANSWQYGHPMGPQGAVLDRTGGNNVVRNNDIVGSETHWWNDALESISNGEVNGGPYRDTDIHGNVLAFSNDDGTELDGGQINVRYWHNWIDKALCGVSCAPNLSGPSYVFRNLIAGLGEERDAAGSAFKMGGGVKWSPGMCFLLHNTIYGKGGGLRSVGYGSDADRGGYVAFSRNNLFAGPGGGDVANVSADPRNDFDYDLTSRGGVSLAVGGEAHAVKETPRLQDADHADFRLADGSPGVDQGCRLPGFNDDFTGAAPDMGAFERGRDDDAIFPPRPTGMSALPLHQTMTCRVGNPADKGEVKLLAPPASGNRWTAYPNSPWLRCVPAEGSTSAEPQTVSVTVANADLALQRYRAAVTFRTDLGYCRTVMVDAKVYPASPVVLSFEAESAKVAGGFRTVRDEAASGGAYLDRPDQENLQTGSAEFSFDVLGDGVYYVTARCFIPSPDAGLHDSFEFAMDGAAKRTWDLEGVGIDRWSWTLVSARDEASPCRFELTKGRHTLVIYTRERLARLDRVAVTNSPYAEEPKALGK
jgi:hypothetical protein